MDERDDRFRAAMRYERELSARQRDVLAMVAKGRSNPEIAESLGVSLAGAKWHVGEVYGKLGLESREDAVAYWHWRNRLPVRLGNAARAMVPGVPLKIAGGAVASVAVVGVVLAWVLFLRDGPEKAVGAYAATIDITAGGAESRVELEYLDPLHFTSRMYRDGTLIATVAADGEWFSTWYEQQGNSQNTTSISDLPFAEEQPSIVVISGTIFAGRILGQDLDGTLDFLDTRNTSPESFARVTGSGNLLGRRVTLIETGPVSTYSTVDSSGQEVHRSEGLTRLWVDDETQVVLREVTEGEGQTLTAEVVAFDAEPEFADDAFDFRPPAGSQQTPIDPDSKGPAPDFTGSPIPPGFLAVTEDPPGMVGSGSNVTFAPPNSRIDHHFKLTGTPAGSDELPALSMAQTERPDEQREVGPPGATKSEVSLPFAERATLVVGPREIALYIRIPLADVVITTNTLTPAELVAWAETLELR